MGVVIKSFVCLSAFSLFVVPFRCLCLSFRSYWLVGPWCCLLCRGVIRSSCSSCSCFCFCSCSCYSCSCSCCGSCSLLFPSSVFLSFIRPPSRSPAGHCHSFHSSLVPSCAFFFSPPPLYLCLSFLLFFSSTNQILAVDVYRQLGSFARGLIIFGQLDVKQIQVRVCRMRMVCMPHALCSPLPHQLLLRPCQSMHVFLAEQFSSALTPTRTLALGC